MFTGIVECLGKIEDIQFDQTNKTFKISSPISSELKVDQSIAHNGVCLTVESLGEGIHCLTAIHETLIKTTLGDWKIGDYVNLERCLKVDGRLDGHFVQGHVDTYLNCIGRTDINGSWQFRFSYPKTYYNLLIPQGSICINGISLTVSKLTDDYFEVSIIPYTFEQTSIHQVHEGDKVNIEFDLLGKYMQRQIQATKLK